MCVVQGLPSPSNTGEWQGSSSQIGKANPSGARLSVCFSEPENTFYSPLYFGKRLKRADFHLSPFALLINFLINESFFIKNECVINTGCNC
jgi:hypothetical protein